ncbi:MAG: nitroreductase family deazaflavin-dependent oxidoreductase [Actinomycetota bacterium]
MDEVANDPLGGLSGESFCYVTTTGRRSGKPHEIEIWFGARGSTLYLLSGGGGRSDWVRNILANPATTVRVDGRTWQAKGRVVVDPDEEAAARRLLAGKYQGWREGASLSRWARTALPVALDLQP